MKIVHISLASAYTEGMNYQDNQLSIQNKLDGHDVTVISDCHEFRMGEMRDVIPEDKYLKSGIRLIRLKYDNIINTYISSKIRKAARLKSVLEKIKPDIILFHGAAGWEIVTAAKYKKENCNCKLFIDNHADYNNSAKNIVSKIFLYKIFNKLIIKFALPYIDKLLYVSLESKIFLKEMYNIPEKKMEFYPLGGQIPSANDKNKNRKHIRDILEINENDILFLHSGKLDKDKRTKDLLEAFCEVHDNKFKLVILGSATKELLPVINKYMQIDKRIIYKGWVSGEDLYSYLCAADMYIQPGTQSATMQNAICCGCAVMLYPYESHIPYIKDNGYFIKNSKDMITIFKKISLENDILNNMKVSSVKLAHNILDYKILARRLYK